MLGAWAGEPRASKPAHPRPEAHSLDVFHLDGAHPAQASALTDVRAATQQPAAAALEVLRVPELETGGRRARRGGAAPVAAARRTGQRAQRLASPGPGPTNRVGAKDSGAEPGLAWTRAAGGFPSYPFSPISVLPYPERTLSQHGVFTGWVSAVLMEIGEAAGELGMRALYLALPALSLGWGELSQRAVCGQL